LATKAFQALMVRLWSLYCVLSCTLGGTHGGRRFGRRQGVNDPLRDQADVEATNLTLRGWIKDVMKWQSPVAPRWRAPTEINLDESLPKPFDREFDQLWVPWLQTARVTGSKLIRKTMWEFHLDATELFAGDHSVWQAATVFNGASGAFGVFRPLWGWRERRADRKAAVNDEPSFCSQVLATESAKELLAFRLERLLGLYRAPPVVFRCFDVKTELAGLDAETLATLLQDASGRTEGTPERICGTMAFGISGVTQLCPRLQTAFCESCGMSAARTIVTEELADLALYDTLVEIDDRTMSKDKWQIDSGMFDGCPSCGTVEKDHGVVVHNLHCAGPTGALLFLDQGCVFRGASLTSLAVPFLQGEEVRGAASTRAGIGLCASPSTRSSVLALGASFTQRFNATMQATCKEVAGAVSAAEGRRNVVPDCHFHPQIIQRVSKTFSMVQQHAAACTAANLTAFYETLRALRASEGRWFSAP
jgi:hypothetical protein